MGAVKVDLSKGEKRLSTLYPLSSPEGVRALFENIHHVREARYTRGDYDATNLLIDFQDAIQSARLTARQQQAITLMYEQDLRQEDIVPIMLISQQAVSIHVTQAIKKIAAYIEQEETRND